MVKKVHSMKRTYITAIMTATITAFCGCDSDADHYYIDGLQESELVCTTTNIVLEATNASQTAVSFVWANESELKIYGPTTAGISSKEMPTYQLQFSLNEDFNNAYTVDVDNGIATYTVQDLNTLVLGLGAKVWEKTTVYVRLNSTYAQNIDGLSSNTLTLYVTCYKVDYRTARILDSSQNETGNLLYSLDNNSDGEADNKGIYEGFMGATAWYNWYLAENNGTIWGNVGEDGYEFHLSSLDNKWNFWFPGVTGCYFTTINTNTAQWSALLIPSLSLSGDIEGEMTYIRAENRWMIVVTTDTDNKTFSIGGTGKLYNTETSTNDDAAIETNITFGSESNNTLVYGGTNKFNIDKAGTYTISLYLNDYSKLTYAIESGAEEIEEAAPAQLYLQGINDIWNFNTYILKCTDEDNLIYQGVFGIEKCQYGLKFNVEENNWDDAYRMGEEEGTIVKTSVDENNIPFDKTGVFIFTVDLKNLTFTTEEVTQVQYSGFNDDWETNPTMTQDGTTYSAPITITKTSEWGGKFLLNGSWNKYVGGTDGKLEWCVSTTDDATLATGDYTLIIDFKNQTFTFDDGTTTTTTYPETLYAVGMNNDWDTFVELSGSNGIYSGTITINSAEETEFEVYDDKNWTLKYGPADNNGNITTGSSAWKFWTSSAGTFTLTINLKDNTYTIE